MRVALVRPPHSGSLGRGVGFYGERLYTALRRIRGLEVELVDFSFWPLKYQKYDLLHFLYFDLFYLTFPPVRPVRTVVTLHDVIPLKFPAAYPLGIRGEMIWPVQRVLLGTADAIITDSQTSKRDIKEITGIEEPKINVTYLAADSAFKPISRPLKKAYVKTKYELPEKFVLYVGGVNWNKNLPTLVRACRQAKLNLVIVGKEAVSEKVDFSNRENQPFREFLDLISGDKSVQLLGFVPTEDLAVIYNLAAVYCQPSIYEGFGLPMLEAMSCGCPVVCGQNSSLAEIGNDAAIYANVTEPKDLADKLLRVVSMPKREVNTLSKKVLARAAQFSWEKTAQETYEIYQKVLAGK